MKKILCLILCLLFKDSLFGQTVSLFHSGTLYDGFENPVQQTFIKDFSRKYAINLFPHLHSNFNFNGDAQTAFKSIIFTKSYTNSNFGSGNYLNDNNINLNTSLYLFTYKIFKTTNYNRELGISLKLNNEGTADIKNGTFSLLNSYTNFNNSSSYNGIFDNSFRNQSYWQLGINYRENYDEKWAFGGKFSILNGTSFNKLNINQSQIAINSNDSYDLALAGTYQSSFGIDSVNLKRLIPNLRNFGFSLSAGTSYTSKNGLYLSANITDLGFINWGNNSSNYQFDDQVTVFNASQPGAVSQLFSEFEEMLNVNETKNKFKSLIDGKINFAASQKLGFYKPTAVFNKSLFNPNGQIALLNTFNKGNFNLSVNPIYDFVSKLNLGSQILIKSANAEFYLGTEQIFPTYYFSKGYLTQNANIGRNMPRASIYLGLSMKFGPKMQDMGNADEIPGLNDQVTGFVVKLPNKQRKALEKKKREIEQRRRSNNKRNRKN
jgi:hypothetical protein